MKTDKTLGQAVDFAKKFEGVPYIWGGNSFLKGLDCSGYGQHILLFLGLYDFQDRTVKGIRRYLEKFEPVESSSKPAGSFLFYGESPGSLEHIAFAISDTELIEAGGAGSNCRTKLQAGLLDANVRIKPINHRKDFLFSLPIKYKDQE